MLVSTIQIGIFPNLSFVLFTFCIWQAIRLRKAELKELAVQCNGEFVVTSKKHGVKSAKNCGYYGWAKADAICK